MIVIKRLIITPLSTSLLIKLLIITQLSTELIHRLRITVPASTFSSIVRLQITAIEA